MTGADVQSLVSQGSCFICYGPGLWPLLKLALLQTIAGDCVQTLTPVNVSGAYNGSGIKFVPLAIGSRYLWVPGSAHDVSIVNGATTLTSAGAFVTTVAATNLIGQPGQTVTASLSLVEVTCTSSGGGATAGGTLQCGNYAGGTPNWIPVTGCGIAIDTSNNRPWFYFSGAWH